MRKSTITRNTKETQIKLSLNIEGSGSFTGTSGIGFFDHMLNAFSTHSGFDIDLQAKGDLFVDCHHTIEDVGIVLGKAFGDILKNKEGINRFGNAFIPMDEALAQAVVDISGRPYLVFNAGFNDKQVGQFDSCMVKEFFQALAFNSGITLHINLVYGENTHHQIEAIFKAVAHALKDAVNFSKNATLLSSKGVLE